MTSELPVYRSVLCVDDNRVFATKHRDLFRTTGRDAEAVFNGHEAVRAVAERTFDVVLLDMRMPGFSGLDVLLEVLKLRPDTCVILLTGYGDVDTACECVRRGAAGMIEKKHTFDQLEHLVTMHFGKHAELLRLREIARQRELAETRRQLLVDVTNVVSHELKNRLPSITHPLDMAKREFGKAGQVPGYLVAAERGRQSLMHLIERLKTFGTADTLRRAPVRLRDAVAKGVTAAREFTTRPHVFEQVSVDDERLPPDLWVWADDGLLAAAVEFLVQNAVDEFSVAGLPKPWVVELTGEEATTANGQAGVRLTVADTGPGFSPELLRWAERIAGGYDRPPYNPNKLAKTNFRLGLSSACRIVATCGGSYALANRPPPGHGAVVSFTLDRTTPPIPSGA